MGLTNTYLKKFSKTSAKQTDANIIITLHISVHVLTVHEIVCRVFKITDSECNLTTVS